LKSVARYSQEYAKLLGNNPFFHGKKAGVIDFSVYGVLNPFKKADTAVFHEFLDADEKIRNWYKRMDIIEKYGLESYGLYGCYGSYGCEGSYWPPPRPPF